MFRKEYIKPGMLVQLKSGELTIASYKNRIREDIFLSWNDRTGRCLQLEDYLDDLTYPNHEELNIDKVYDIGIYCKPFDMDTSARSVLWDRYSNYRFSGGERTTAACLIGMLNMFSKKFNSKIPIKYNSSTKKIYIGNNEVCLIIPEEFFPNLKESTTLEAINDGEIL